MIVAGGPGNPMGRLAMAAWLMLTSPAFAANAGPGAAEPVAPLTAPAAEVEEGPRLATPTTLDRMGRILAPVMVNGRGPFRFILDTGANRSAISRATLEAAGLSLDGASMVNVHGITGTAVLPAVLVPSFRAGDLEFENQRFPVLPTAVFGDADGILGIDCLQDARIEVDFAGDVVTIRPSPRRRARPDYLVIPAHSRHGGLLLVDGRVGGIRVKAILDTGAERSLGNDALRQALASRSRRESGAVATNVIGATPHVTEGTSFVAPTISLGGARLKQLMVTFGDLHVFNLWSLNDQPALLIGMDLLGTLRNFVVDYPRREFHLRAWPPKRTNKRCVDVECHLMASGS